MTLACFYFSQETSMNRNERRRRKKMRPKTAGQSPDAASSMTRALEFHQNGRLDEAAGHYKDVLKAEPQNIIAHSNLGAAYNDLGQLAEAMAWHDKALAIDPKNVEAHNNKGNTLKALGRLEDSITCFQKAIILKPDLAQVHYNLGTVFQDLGQLPEAADCFQKAIVLHPDYADAHNNLGNVHKDLGRFDDAITSYRKSLALRPNHAATHNNFGDGLREQGLWDEALACFRKALELEPDLAEAHSNLGHVLQEFGQLDEAVESVRKAISLKPDYAEAHNTLGNILNSLGQLEEAIACYEKAIDLKPDFPLARNNHLHGMLYLPKITNQELFRAHRRIAGEFVFEGRLPVQQPDLTRPPGSRLRIGYVSSDFHGHPVGRNVLPLISNHDHDQFEIFCYSEATKHDDTTDQFMHHADHWRVIKTQSNAEVAEQIRKDGINIMVYLGGYFDSNRPSIARHRPAPVQVSMHAGGTTALDEMDFWLSDAVLHPDTTTELFTEELVQLPNFYAYPIPEDTPQMSALPVDENGFVTFVSFNKPCKMTDDVLDLWSEILTALPDARLHLKFKNYLATKSLSQRIMARFEHNAITPDRIALLAGVDTVQDHLALYTQADIALDTFPFSGATTTFQALWMGVPVISLAGERFITRMGASLSLHTGIDGVTAQSTDEYVEQAVALANDRPRLRELRASLRERLGTSPLCDGPGYARNLENAFKIMWAKKSEK
jgi:predicted O-linked N-acetylglucosamine transferase (SPINDLY family)